MPDGPPKSGLSAVIEALEQAELGDLNFAAEQVAVHSMSSERKVGYRLVAVRAIPIALSVLISYVRAEGPKGIHWYVVDNSERDTSNRPMTISALSEEDAKTIVLERARSAVRKMAAAQW